MKTKKIRIASYKGCKTFFSKLISFKQRYIDDLPKRYAKYTHSEIIFEDWMSFSSSEVDWWVRFKKINYKSEHWDFVDIDIPTSKYEKIYNIAKLQSWNGYNWFSIFFSQILKMNIKWEHTFFCSEIVTHLLQICHISDRICHESAIFVSPWKLLYLLEDGERIITNE